MLGVTNKGLARAWAQSSGQAWNALSRLRKDSSRGGTSGCRCRGGGGQDQRLTFALQTLPQEAPEQGAAVVAEGGNLVVVDPELVGHVDTEPLGAHLQGRQNTGSPLSSLL